MKKNLKKTTKSLAGLCMATAIALSSLTAYAAGPTAPANQPADITSEDSDNIIVIEEGTKKIVINGTAIRNKINAVIDYVDSTVSYINNLRTYLFTKIEERALDADMPAYDWSTTSGGDLKLTITIPSTAKTSGSSIVHGSSSNNHDGAYDGAE